MDESVKLTISDLRLLLGRIRIVTCHDQPGIQDDKRVARLVNRLEALVITAEALTLGDDGDDDCDPYIKVTVHT